MDDGESPIPMTSPLPKKQKTMGFYEALKAVAEKKKVTSLTWGDKKTFLFLQNGRVKIHKGDTNTFHDLIISDGDLMATDFVIIE